LPQKHIVEAGECLSSIARTYGFVNWRVIWNDKGNADLRKRHPNPDIIAPGDEIVIPEKKPKEISVGKGASVNATLKPEKAWLRLVLFADPEKKAPKGRWELKVEGVEEPEKGDLPADGTISVEVPSIAKKARLSLFLTGGDDPDEIRELSLGHLDPASRVAGAQERLRRLGYECGPVDGILGVRTRSALLTFQEQNGLDATGALDQPTVSKLVELFEGADGVPKVDPEAAAEQPPAEKEAAPASSTDAAPLTEQDKAKDIVRTFAAAGGGGVFIHIARADVASGLLDRVDHPDKIDQGSSSLCGPAALTADLATNDPVAYVKFVISLYEKGVADVQRLHISAGTDLRRYDPAGKVAPADWIPLASIRDSENWFFDYQSADDEFAGITLPNHLEGWFKRVGFTKVVNDTNLVAHKDESNLKEAARLYRDDYWVCLFINANALQAATQASSSLVPDHWVVLESDVAFAAGNVSFNVYTWGDGHRPVPNDPSKPLSLASFLANYYGYVAAKH
jgi:hypothetical protein